jgi:hypothetical protein
MHPRGGIGSSLKVSPRIAFLMDSRLTPYSRGSFPHSRSPEATRSQASRTCSVVSFR